MKRPSRIEFPAETIKRICTDYIDTARRYAKIVRNRDGGQAMRTASGGEVQKNFARILDSIDAGEVIVITRRGRPIARLIAMGPQQDVEWPVFLFEAVELPGVTIGEILDQQREERF